MVAYLKMRRRNLGALFEGAEWAINARLRITRGLARLFTSDPTFPSGTRKERRDVLSPLARRHRKRTRERQPQEDAEV